MAGAVEKVEVDEWTGFKDNDWKALTEQVKLEYDAAGIEIPFQQLDVNVKHE